MNTSNPTWYRSPEELNKLQAWERIQDVKEETGLTSQWEELHVECPHCDSPEFVYIYDDNKTLYCLACAVEFELSDLLEDDSIEIDLANNTVSAGDIVSDDPATVNAAIKILDIAKPDANKTPIVHKGAPTGGSTSYGNYTQWDKFCFHRPQHVIAGEGWGIWAGKKDDVKSAAKQFDVVLNLTYSTIKENHVIPIPALAKWESYSCPYEEIQLDWMDYGVIDLPVEFWMDFLTYLKENKKRCLVFCQGGHGRTGTAIAVMLVLSLGYTAANAIAWVRKNYCHHAIETKGQENYVLEMAKAAGETLEPEPVKEITTNA